MPVALDATYSLGDELSGVGVYSREILYGLAAAHPDERFLWCYRPHRYLRCWREPLPPNCRRYLLHDTWRVPPRAAIYHALNQRLPRGAARSVCTFHDLFVITGEYSTPDFRRRFEQQAREAARRADLIIAVSAFTASQVVSLLGVERSRVRVIHHGVRPLPPQDSIEREKIVLHVGAIQTRKNIVRLVEAFEQMDGEWRLVLAGSAGFGAAASLDRIESSPARARIRVTGYVSPADLARLYRRASIFAFPSLDEGFGMPVLEAMAAGVPVITSNRSALPEVAGDAALLVDPFRTEAIAAALRAVAGDAALRDELIRRGRERARQFCWETAVKQTWSVYEELRG